MGSTRVVPDDQLLVLGIGLVVIIAAWIPVSIERSPVSLPLVLVALGACLFALPWFHAPDPREHVEVTRRVTEFGVLVALVGAGISIDRPLGVRRWAITWRLLSVGMLASIGGITVLGMVLLRLDLPTSLLLGAVLAPTDPVLASDVQVGEPALEESRLDDEDDVRFGLTSEAGMNDGLAFPFVHLALVLAAATAAGSAGDLAWLPGWLAIDVGYRLAAGAAIGWLVGRVLGRLVFDGPGRLPPIAASSQGFVALGITMVAYGLTELLHGYGFLAVFVAALSLRRTHRTDEYHSVLHGFASEIEQAVSSVLLVLFGGAAALLLDGAGWRAVATSAIVLLVVRPLAGHLSLLGSPVRWNERRAIAFFGIRGVGSMYYLAYAAAPTVTHARATPAGIEALWPVVTCTILLSITIHGITATGVMRHLDRTRARQRRVRSSRTRPGPTVEV
jgi:sodium/hydrogen antiporter